MSVKMMPKKALVDPTVFSNCRTISGCVVAVQIDISRIIQLIEMNKFLNLIGICNSSEFYEQVVPQFLSFGSQTNKTVKVKKTHHFTFIVLLQPITLPSEQNCDMWFRVYTLITFKMYHKYPVTQLTFVLKIKHQAQLNIYHKLVH